MAEDGLVPESKTKKKKKPIKIFKRGENIKFLNSSNLVRLLIKFLSRSLEKIYSQT
jgi:hypothetical protein